MFIGVDEVGTGALAGPVTACACALLDGWEHTLSPALLDDSKKLTDHHRRAAESALRNNSEYVVYAMVFASPNEIERIGIRKVTKNLWTDAIDRALYELGKRRLVPDLIMIDGNQLPKIPKDFSITVECEPKADGRYPEVSAASILAKVWRDDRMIEYGRQQEYAKWHFGKHKGYGTPEHRTAIKTYGLSDIHRSQFCQKILAKDPWGRKLFS